jgi:hypothetical protein
MDTKLTLKLDRKIIEKAKAYASDQKLSLSSLVENYFDSLTSEKKYDADDITISPFVKSMSSDVSMVSDYDYRSEYGKHLDEKYK